MTDDRLSDFETVVVPHIEFLYQVAMGLTGDAARAEDVIVATLTRAARSFDGVPPDRGLLLGEVYRRVSKWEMQPVEVPLARLPQSYRDVVLLTSLPEVRLADAATALGLPVETVRTRRRRAFALMYRRRDEGSSGT